MTVVWHLDKRLLRLLGVLVDAKPHLSWQEIVNGSDFMFTPLGV
jgi:hypothetical protein